MSIALVETPKVSTMTQLTMPSNPATVPSGMNQIEVMHLSRSFHQANMAGLAQRLNGFEILWINRGEGMLFVDFQAQQLTGSTIYLMLPGQYRRIQFSTDAIDGYVISLSADFVQLTHRHIDDTLFVTQCVGNWRLPVLSSDNDMDQLILKIHTESTSDNMLRQEVLKGLVDLVIIYLSRKMPSLTSEVSFDRDFEILKQFISLVRRDFASKKLVAEYAGDLCISPNYLNSIVKRVTGFPASYHIQQCIMFEAKWYARYSNLRLKEIAEKLGFDDYAHFSKFFKNYSGMSFSNFRKAIS